MDKDLDKKEVIEVRAPVVGPQLPRPPFDTPMITVKPTVAEALKQAVQNISQPAASTDDGYVDEKNINQQLTTLSVASILILLVFLSHKLIRMGPAQWNKAQALQKYKKKTLLPIVIQLESITKTQSSNKANKWRLCNSIANFFIKLLLVYNAIQLSSFSQKEGLCPRSGNIIR